MSISALQTYEHDHGGADVYEHITNGGHDNRDSDQGPVSERAHVRALTPPPSGPRTQCLPGETHPAQDADSSPAASTELGFGGNPGGADIAPPCSSIHDQDIQELVELHMAGEAVIWPTSLSLSRIRELLRDRGRPMGD